MQMAADMFLKLGDIKGESKDKTHKDEIELLAWNLAVTQTGSAGRGGGSGTGKVEMGDISFTKNIDKSSTKLFISCAKGDHIPKAEMAMRKAGGEQKEYLKISLDDVMVSSYSTSGASGGESPMENVSLTFGKISIEYFEQDNKGSVTSAGKVGWDVKQNTHV
jgi:type VI secretion system secreted protein Hcp